MHFTEKIGSGVLNIVMFILIVGSYIIRTVFTYQTLYLLIFFMFILLLTYFVLYILYSAGGRAFISIDDFFKTVFSKYMFSSSYTS
jgi:hypothetical protein